MCFFIWSYFSAFFITADTYVTVNHSCYLAILIPSCYTPILCLFSTYLQPNLCKYTHFPSSSCHSHNYYLNLQLVGKNDEMPCIL